MLNPDRVTKSETDVIKNTRTIVLVFFAYLYLGRGGGAAKENPA